ncbi:MAG: Lrp/AsnC family transcriptional regulator [Verrucomicrobiota bacterium]
MDKTDELLTLLRENARQSNGELAELLGLAPDDVASAIARLEEDGAILGYSAVIDPEVRTPGSVLASIEVKMTPERDGGYDRLAERIARFPQVKDCYLMSGGFDLWVVVEGQDLREVARFVSENLSTLEGVISTGTHFQLKTYKENGKLRVSREEPSRLSVSP